MADQRPPLLPAPSDARLALAILLIGVLIFGLGMVFDDLTNEDRQKALVTVLIVALVLIGYHEFTISRWWTRLNERRRKHDEHETDG